MFLQLGHDPVQSESPLQTDIAAFHCVSLAGGSVHLLAFLRPRSGGFQLLAVSAILSDLGDPFCQHYLRIKVKAFVINLHHRLQIAALICPILSLLNIDGTISDP